jgi:hypothetical protein
MHSRPAEGTGDVAYQRHRLTGAEEGLDELERIRIFGQIPHWAVAARIEDGIVILLHGLENPRPPFGLMPANLGCHYGLVALIVVR